MLKLIEMSQPAAARYEAAKRNVEAARAARSGDWLHQSNTR
jgi:hypothetical protein